MESRKRKMGERRQKTKEVKQSVSTQFEQMNLLIEAVDDMHDSILELTEIMKKSIAEPEPLDMMRKTEPIPANKIEEKPALSFRELFGLKPKKAIPVE